MHPFTYVPPPKNNNKQEKTHLSLNLRKYEWELDAENLKTPKKEIKEVLNRWGDVPCLWIGRLKCC